MRPRDDIRKRVREILDTTPQGVTTYEVSQMLNIGYDSAKSYLGEIEHVIVCGAYGHKYHCTAEHEAHTRHVRSLLRRDKPKPKLTRVWPKGRDWTPPPRIPTSVWDLAA